MLRRRLTAYTMMYAAGIAAGCFVFERGRSLEAAGFMLSIAAAICMIDPGPDTDPYRLKNFRKICLILTVLGFLMFALSHHSYGSYADMCLVTSEDGTPQNHRLEGRVTSAAYKDGKLRFTVENSCRVRVYLSAERDEWDTADLTGASVICTGEYKEILPADDPGCFDYRIYMRAKKTAVSFRAISLEITDEGSGPLISVRRELYRTREAFTGRFGDETAGFIRGVIFGDKSGIDDETVSEFNANSTGHILAVSGLHIGFLYSLLKMLSGRRKTKSAALMIVLILIIYGEMTQWSAATVRACIVMSISLMSVHFRKPFDLLSAVSLAALLILIYEPYQLFDAGFRMSFLAMTAMAFLTKPLSMVAGKTLGAMMSIQLGLMPVLAYSFCRVNLLAVFINIPVILLASLLVPLCILMLMGELLFGIVPGSGIWLAELMSSAVLMVNHMLSFDGGFSYMTAGAGAFMTAALYVLIFGASSEWTRVQLLRKNTGGLLKTFAVILMPLLMLSSCLADTLRDDEIVFVSVGQGDCVHIRAAGRNLLIDGGGRDDFDTGEKILMPYLLHSGIGTVDMALVTHLHTDHFRGICELADIYPVGAVGIPADYRAAPEIYGKDGTPGLSEDEEILYIKPDTVISIDDDIYIDVIWPLVISDEPIDTSEKNEHNNVYMIHYNGVKIMVTGDLLEKDELEMVDHYSSEGDTEKLRCDILKVAHHGSRSSSSDAFLDAASPDIAVIQAGAGNVYGHPHTETLDKLSKRDIKVYRTDRNGAVGIDIKRRSIRVDTFRNK